MSTIEIGYLQSKSKNKRPGYAAIPRPRGMRWVCGVLLLRQNFKRNRNRTTLGQHAHATIYSRYV